MNLSLGEMSKIYFHAKSNFTENVLKIFYIIIGLVQGLLRNQTTKPTFTERHTHLKLTKVLSQ